MKKLLIIVSALLINITGCTVYVSPDSATIIKKPRPRNIPAADPGYTNPAALPRTSVKQDVITEIQGTPATPSTKTVINTTDKVAQKPTQTFYTVKPKDTVFSIMRKTNANWSDIIRINSLEPPKYTIHPGQVLRLK